MLFKPACRAALSVSPSPIFDVTVGSDSIDFSLNGEDISTVEPYTTLFDNYKNVAVLILGICIITSLICFLVQITKLGAAGDNQNARTKAIKGVMISGIVLAAFGALTTIVGVFWGALA